MLKFMILFRQPPDQEVFESHYNKFLALVETMPHIIRRQINPVIGSPMGESPYYRILEIYFENQQTLDDSLKGEAGQEAARHLRGLPGGSFEMIFAEVYEETGGFTPA